MERQIKVAVLGGGVAGVVLASELSKSSLLAVDLIEKAPKLGGFHRNIHIDGINYDIGAFTFGQDHSIFRAFPTLINLFNKVDSRFALITPCGSIDDYPFTLKGYIRDNGWLLFYYSCLELLYCKLRYWKRDTLLSFVKYYMGGSVYARSGLKTYIERLYGSKDEDIDIEFARKRLSLIQEHGSLIAIASKFFQGQKTALAVPPTEKQVFVRPVEGFDKIYSTIEGILLSQGVSVITSCQIRAVKRKNDGFEIDFPDRKKFYDRVVSTIPVSTMSELIGMPLEQKLDTRTLSSLFYRFRGELGHDSTVLHNFSPEGDWKRIITFSKYYGTHEGDDYFVVEVTFDNNYDPNLLEQKEAFEAQIKGFGLLKGELKYQGGLVTQNAYPVYRRDNVDRIAAAKQRLKQWGLDLAGRQGEFDYISSSDAAGKAKIVAEKIKADYGEV